MDETRSGDRPEGGVIDSDPRVLGGTPVFAGTEVAVQALLDALEGGWSVEEFLLRHPAVRREQAIEVLRRGVQALLAGTDQPPRRDASRLVRDKAEVLRRIAAASPRIRALGVRRLSLFGSFARGEQKPGSDVDFLVDFEEGATTFEHLVDLAHLLEDLLGRKVQVVTRDGLSRHVGPHILAEAEHVPLAA
jgi:uncharacterized protein